jgi:hypothetical protein
MSSVTRFIRQIQPDSTYFSAATVVSNAATDAYELVPASSAVVGNYPAGTMTVAGAGALYTAITNVNGTAGGKVILRDMGKTVQAPITSASPAVSYFFRQVQLISLVNGVNGKVDEPTVNTDYLTFYIPISVAGSVSARVPLVSAACQM